MACLICLFSFSSATLHAQSTAGSLVGAVTDTTGAALPGATVTLTNVDTADKRTATTNSTGEYTFVGLPPGNYQVDVEESGFKHYTHTNAVVQVNVSTRVDASLSPGDVSQTVQVSSEVPLLETQQATISQVVAGRAVSELPLNGREVMNLIAVAPGVIPVQGTTPSNGVSALEGGSVNYMITGGLPNTGAEFVDGGLINTAHTDDTAYTPSQDSIQEFNVESTNIGPEYGGTENGVVAMVTKSGTNQFHGVAYDYLRNTVLDANTFFGNRAHLATPAFKQNQYGATLGGPIKKDKLFFFGSFEGARVALGATSSYTVPTLAERSGNLSSVSTPITDPGTFDPTYTKFTPNPAGVTFPGNMIPANRIDPTSQLMLAWWALPNQPGTSNNYIVNTTTYPSLDQYIARLDWTKSDRQRIFGKYAYQTYTSNGADAYGYMPNYTALHGSVHQFNLGDDYTFNPTTIMDLRFSYLRVPYLQNGDTHIPNQLSADTAWPANTIANMDQPIVPAVAVSGISANGGGGQIIKITGENYTLSGSITKLLGRHTLKFGGEWRYMPNNYGATDHVYVESFNFTNAFTGNPFASYLLGDLQSTETENDYFPDGGSYYYGTYINDNFQPNSRLSVNVGLRWEYPGYWTERHNRQAVFLPNATSPLAGPTGLPLKGNVALVATPAYPGRTNQVPHYDLFSPRIGLAYRVTNSTVIRSGFAILDAAAAVIEQTGQPYSNSDNLAYTQINTTTQPVNAFHNPFPGGILQPVGRSANFEQGFLGQTAVVPVANQPSTYLEQWNLDFEHDLAHDTVFEIAYVGTKGNHQQSPAGNANNGLGIDQLPDQYDSMGNALLNPVANPFSGLISTGNLSGATVPAGQLLRPYPQYYNLYSPVANQFFSRYNGLLAKVTKRFAAGGNLLLAYTWSSNRGNTDTATAFTVGEQEGIQQDNTNLKGEVSQLSFNLPQVFVASYVTDLPFGRGKRFLGTVSGVANKVVSGWGVDGITTYSSGYPLVITAQPTYLSSVFGAGTPRPNLVPGCAKVKSGSAASKVTGWFNTSCFTQPGNFSFGNEPRVDPTLRTQGTANWDVALFKGIAVSDRLNVQFRTEIFNTFNRVQLGDPNDLCCSSTDTTFGVVSSQQNNPRQIQFALKLMF